MTRMRKAKCGMRKRDDPSRRLGSHLAPLYGLLAVGGMVVVGSGCARPRKPLLEPARERLVWPTTPERERVRYLGQIAGPFESSARSPWSAAWNRTLFGPEDVTSLITPQAVAVHADGNRVAIADPNAHCVHLIDLAAQQYLRLDANALEPVPSQRAAGLSPRGSVDSVPADQSFTAPLLDAPIGVTWAGDTLWIADSRNPHLILVEWSDSQAASPRRARHAPRLAARVVRHESLVRPAGLAYDPENERIHVADAGAHVVHVFERSGAKLFSLGERGAAPGKFNFPAHVACGPAGEIVVSDGMNFRVQRFAADGEWRSAFGRKGDAPGDFALPKGVAVDRNGHIWVVDAQFENVQAFDAEGRLLLAFGGEGHGAGEFWLPAGAAVDAQGRLWVADTYNRRVQVFELVP